MWDKKWRGENRMMEVKKDRGEGCKRKQRRDGRMH